MSGPGPRPSPRPTTNRHPASDAGSGAGPGIAPSPSAAGGTSPETKSYPHTSQNLSRDAAGLPQCTHVFVASGAGPAAPAISDVRPLAPPGSTLADRSPGRIGAPHWSQ